MMDLYINITAQNITNHEGIFEKSCDFSNYFVFKDSATENGDSSKKSIGVELLQSRINLSETNDLFS